MLEALPGPDADADDGDAGDETSADAAPTDPSAEFRRNRSGERLQKVLARAGIASRRAAESLIVAGRVRVDGQIVSELGVRVSSRARVELDGRKIVAEHFVYLMLHKPRGVVCTLKDPEGRPNVGEYLREVGARVSPVGRLDFHTSGALLCTNDGEFAAKLAHPRYQASKDYVAKVRGVLDETSLARFRESIEIDGRATRPAQVSLLRVEGDKSWIGVTLGEGKNRQVRRLGEHAGFLVMRLVRVSQAGVSAEGLRPGEWRHLTLDELAKVQEVYGVPKRLRPPPLREQKFTHETARPMKRTPQRGRNAVHGLNLRAAAGRHSSLMFDDEDMPVRAPKRGPSRFESGGRVAPSRTREGAIGSPRTPPWQRDGAPRPQAGSRDPGRNSPFDRGGSRGPNRADTRGPNRADTRGPNRADTRGPKHADTRGPKRADTRGPKRDDARGPKREGAGRPAPARGRDAGSRARPSERGGRGSAGRRGT